MSTSYHESAAALLERWRTDAFGVLGPHCVVEGQWEIRVFAPDAESVEAHAVDGGAKLCKLRLAHESGLWIGDVKRPHRPDYVLAFIRSGVVTQSRDPYSFGLVLDTEDLLAARGEGTRPAYESLGAHRRTIGGVEGMSFAVWAPNAMRVSVVGPFNHWDGRTHAMRLRHFFGVWELFIPGLGIGVLYKYEIHGPDGSLLPLKADPYAFAAELPPATASVTHALGGYSLAPDNVSKPPPRERAISIYECHPGSWARVSDEGNRYLTYREMAAQLLPYVHKMGFTHIELLPITEYPFDGSWGYQPISLYAPTSRFGTPEDFAFFVEEAHRLGLGVLLDWVPAHFPNDAHGLACFDGTHLYEHADPRQGVHQDWGTLIYNFGRKEVEAFLVSNARFWLERYGVDGLRVDAVASMLYLDYSREPGDWVPNRHGGRENLEAVAFLHRVNEMACSRSTGVITIAEESTAWPGVSRPTWAGGLGFGFKWNMGWMNDTLRYMARDPIYRRHHHSDLTFGLLYAFSENFVLPLSHDEVVHGKRSLLGRMPGDRWRQFANLRAYYGFMWGHPGKKLLFMGNEFAQHREWDHDSSLDWHLLKEPLHKGVQDFVRDLNNVYRASPALHERDCEADGFQWIVGDDHENSVLAFARFDKARESVVIVVCNFTPVPRYDYRIGAPRGGIWREIVNSDSGQYGGSGVGNGDELQTINAQSHGFDHTLCLICPPLATIMLEWRPD